MARTRAAVIDDAVPGAGLIPVAPATSQTGGGTQIPAAQTQEQRVHVGQIPGVMATQPVVPIQPLVRATSFEEEQLRLSRFKKYDPPTFSGLTSESAQEIFLREFVPQSLRDAWHSEFERLRQGTMSVSEYAVRFSDLARHAPALVATVREHIRSFIEGLRHDIRFTLEWELELDVSFQ
ncbi:uncharacterized protein [Nicotiana tomentosiformis]|uniref:uncharacterized protein n=1 Tax=Nicotiana tomentosiformis TaxID=4098 RepID=UPI00388CDF44